MEDNLIRWAYSLGVTIPLTESSEDTEEVVLEGKYKVVVTGSRDWNDWAAIEEQLRRVQGLAEQVVIIHGGARGADKMCQYKARQLGLEVLEVPAEWDRLGKRAGHVRNTQMLDLEPDEVVAFWLDRSRGTADCIRQAREAHIPVTIIEAFTTDGEPKRKVKNMDTNVTQVIEALVKSGATPETIAQAVLALTNQAPLTNSSNTNTDVTYHPTLKDQSGNALKLSGQGVRQISGTRKRPSCFRCGAGNVAWVESRNKHPEGHPKAGQPKVYLAQAYDLEDGNRVALAFELHSNYCSGGDTPRAPSRSTVTPRSRTTRPSSPRSTISSRPIGPQPTPRLRPRTGSSRARSTPSSTPKSTRSETTSGWASRSSRASTTWPRTTTRWTSSRAATWKRGSDNGCRFGSSLGSDHSPAHLGPPRVQGLTPRALGGKADSAS